MTGKRVWARNLGVPDNHYGHSSSLIIWNNHLLVQYDSNKGGKLLSLDTATGNTRWETTRQVGISWASPILAEIGGNTQVILSADPLVAGYDPETGKELWSVDCMMGEVGPSPAFGEGLVYAANEYARLVAIRPGAADPVVWENDEYLPEIASPVVSGGLLFIATSYGVLVCYDAASGEKYWEEEAQQGFSASPLVADGKLYAMDTGGIMHIFSLSKEMKKLGTPTLGERAYASPAFSDGTIYLRGEKYLYCIGNE
jgi:outer membrane protein assembly factor BamB